MSTTFGTLPKTLQLFIKLEMKIARFPCELIKESQTDFGPEPADYRPRDGERVHLLDHNIGIVIEHFGRRPSLRLSEKGNALGKDLLWFDGVYFPTRGNSV